jgi:HSP20 family protein
MPTDTTIQKRETPLAQTEPVRAGPTYIPPVDIIEQDDKLLLLADLPGAKSEDADVKYERGTLTIYAPVTPRQDPERTTYMLREYGVGDYCRTFQIGEGIDANKIAAEFQDGVLTLHLPKTQELMPRKIKVKTT